MPMSEHTSMRVGGPADVMAFPRDESDLRDLIKFAETKRFVYHVIGGGTNVLVRDGGIRGLVINLADGFREVTWTEKARAVVGGSVKLSSLVKECAEKGLGGLEFAAGIPGTVAGAVVMNAGAFGGEMKDVVEGVEVIGRKGKKTFIPAAELEFGYRTSTLPEGAVVVRVHLAFTESTPEEVKGRVDEVTALRTGSAPVRGPNSGSVFRNPENDHAGRLIDEAGLKGETLGGAEVSTAHANYIVNTGNARAADVLGLMATIRDKVYRETGVLLEPEIKVIGED